MRGQIVKANSFRYTVLSDGQKTDCVVRGVLKRYDELYVGDFVQFDKNKRERYGIITAIEERRNLLIRPYVSNSDIVLIVIAGVPETDFLLVDKLIVNCHAEDIRPIIVVNKIDLNESAELVERVYSEYRDVAEINVVSAVTGQGLDKLKETIGDGVAVLAGQSAVGKSALINALFGKRISEVGELSLKIERGKNTTRTITMIVSDGLKIVDTCGFSSFSFPDLKPEKLGYYYDDFAPFAEKCKYRSCLHKYEPECAVKDAVNKGIISKNRYDRYLSLLSELSGENKKKD